MYAEDVCNNYNISSMAAHRKRNFNLCYRDSVIRLQGCKQVQPPCLLLLEMFIPAVMHEVKAPLNVTIIMASMETDSSAKVQRPH